jgi:hypothetical protein
MTTEAGSKRRMTMTKQSQPANRTNSNQPSNNQPTETEAKPSQPQQPSDKPTNETNEQQTSKTITNDNDNDDDNERRQTTVKPAVTEPGRAGRQLSEQTEQTDKQ